MPDGDRYALFKLRHEDHRQSELIHYVGTPVTIAEIEQRLGPKNHVTHVLDRQQWKRLAKV